MNNFNLFLACTCISIALISNTPEGNCAGILATSIRDHSRGVWVPGVATELYKAQGDTSDLGDLNWALIASNKTNSAGKIRVMFSGPAFSSGLYKLVWYTEPYFTSQNQETFFPYAESIFEKIDADENLTMLVPLMIAPYAYNTYRGSLRR